MKKALCVLLSALLLSGAMSCMLTVASAASYITTINLSGVNGDNEITSADARSILRKSVGLD